MDDLSGGLSQARTLWLAGEYQQAAGIYEQAIATEPDHQTHYWHLGLMLLLMGQEAEAQMTWLMAPDSSGDLDLLDDIKNIEDRDLESEQESEAIANQTIDKQSDAQAGLPLDQILNQECDRQVELGNLQMAWVIRQYLREFFPADINNLLQLVQLSISIGSFQSSDLIDLGLIDALASISETPSTSEPTDSDFDTALEPATATAGSTPPAIEPELILTTMKAVLDCAIPSETEFEFTAAAANYIYCFIPQVNILDQLRIMAEKLNYTRQLPHLAVRVVKICLALEPENVDSLIYIAHTYSDAREHSEAIAHAQRACDLAERNSWSLAMQIIAHYCLLKVLMIASGYWQRATATNQKIQALCQSLYTLRPELSRRDLMLLRTVNFFSPYFEDKARPNRTIQNQFLQFCQDQAESIFQELIPKYRNHHQQLRQQNQASKHNTSNRPLKIGYLSSCMRRHSVGWLARWLFQYHNRDRFEIYTYFINFRQTDDKLQTWYAQKSDQAYRGGIDGKDDGVTLAKKIFADQVDILIDLDSITSYVAPEVLSLKPAPIQVSWLGLDATGVPTVDYFIADHYVLPEYAQEYYSEKIWRLPHTYLAVEGFETSAPTLNRDRLDIPADAVVFLTAQTGQKRHPDTTRMQLQIISQVPNSYLLIKGIADQESMQNLFKNLAIEAGVSENQLKFLPLVKNEETHRANLAIADVVLDTYPYNGATTTMETLWMGIPIVTRVGEQFSARNSYGMMINAGINEGIAWSDQEYIEWGVRLGKDEKLRQQIAYKLRMGRHSAPLWNAKQFVKEMEDAYTQMWQAYVG
ncbi:hypothetical protein Pse7367_0828 [Thalassoporum mexicanum PCC 7367]|uniref:O-linked N-acetylglucosamine transferase, SPINDLY family protein n=1 Tax=Thalassoporum mexicanum TaxID=3457544 RepID=UPI00029FA871|nr:tetratricopeptide repeat protein [Pseudanabaena sp. PCC 7367]AFY69128.1 hypothetical protein Pse7367_0828 [Pseudanabaena sp. PCC 7367]